MRLMDTSTRRRGRRQQARLWRVPVRRVRPLTPRMVRITVGGDELADFPAAGTDQNVMLYFYDDDVELTEPLTLGPSPNYTPNPDADWSLLAGHETAIPAIAATLRGLPAGKRVLVFIEVTDVTDEQPLPTAADAAGRWLYR